MSAANVTGQGWQPKDQAARERIVGEVGQNMCVEAGAGTGKTTVLVDRIVRVLATGHAAIEQIVVITFTEKAAAELSGRVRRGLEEALAQSSGEQERQRLLAALRGLNRAHIETIHAFAAALLKERPVEAGLDPGFEVLDELPAQLAFESAYGDWITEQLALDPPPAALVEALDLGMEWVDVRKAAEKLNRHRDVLPLPPYGWVDPDLEGTLSTFAASLATFTSVEREIIDTENVTFTEFERMRREYAHLDELRGSPAALAAALCVLGLPNARNGAAEDWRGRCGAVAKGALLALRKACESTRRAFRQNAAAGVVTWLQDFVRFYDKQRRDEGTADFDDLLIWARNLVRDHADAREYFRGKFTCVLVDEFQDTDPLQAEMIVRLCAEDGGIADWRHAKLRPGSLFAVGDPKQSIYRFRRADIGMYDEVKRHVFGGTPEEITQNFRSTRPILEWVNEVFAGLISEKDGVQPKYIDLEHRDDVTEGGVLVLRGGIEGGGAPALRRAEAQALAALIAGKVQDGGWKIRDGETSRAAGFGDIAMLIPSRAELHIYEDELSRASVPYRHEGGRSFFMRQEVRDLVAVLRAVDDPTDQVAIVAALRSPAFACSDEDLFLYRGGGRFDYLTIGEEEPGVVAASLRALRELARARHEMALGPFVRHVIDGLRLVEFAMLQHQGEQAAANVLKVIDQARAYSQVQRSVGLRGFVRWLRENINRESEETDAFVAEETDDVVRIVTIHGAKGLEFPVVVFANMNTQRPDTTNIIVTRGERAGTCHLRIGKKDLGFGTPGYDEAEAGDLAHADAERRRLLYVAATRAKDHLVVSLFEQATGGKRGGSKRDEPSSLNDLLRLARAGEAGDVLDAETLPQVGGEPPAVRVGVADGDGVEAESIIDARESWRALRDTALSTGNETYVIRTASGLKEGWEPMAGGSDDVRRGPATDFGTAVHVVLERADLARPELADALAEAAGAEHGMRERAAEMADCVRNVLGHEVTARALASPRMLREVAFAAPLPEGGGLAEGRMDLLFVEGGEIVVVDFKTDAVREVDLQRRAEMYRAQALVYAWAAARTTGLQVREVILLFARLPAPYSFRVDAAFLAEAEALLAGPGSGAVPAPA